MRKLYITMTLSLFFGVAHSQVKDYLITNAGDTLKGKISYNLFSKKVRLKTDHGKLREEDGNYTEYYVTRKNLHYQKITVENKKNPMWARVLEDGDIKLFETVHKRPKNHEDIVWFIQKNGPYCYPVKRNGIGGNLGRSEKQDILYSFIDDNKEVLRQYENKHAFTFKNIRDLIRAYNRS